MIMDKKKNWPPLKELLFSYLAITKILYYFNTVMTMENRGLWSAVETVLRRLNQDAIIIIGVILFYYLDKFIKLKKSKYSTVLEYAIFYAVGYIMLMGVALAYVGIMTLIFGTEYVQIDSWGMFMGYSIVSYGVVAIALNVKQYFKGKAKPKDMPVHSTNDKLVMLEELHNAGVLTQEELASKKEMLLSKGAFTCKT